MMLPGAIEGVDVLTYARLTYELARRSPQYGEASSAAAAHRPA
jgi:hypothetical protein